MSGIRDVLITGSSGHLGSRVLELLRSRYQVHAVVRRLPLTAYPDVVYHEIDLSGDWSASALPNRMDTVIHLAQSRNYRDFPGGALETFRVNTGATALLLDYANRVGATRFVLASTGGLYSPGKVVIDADTPLQPPRGELGYYFQSKLAAERLAECYSALLAVMVLRPFFIYGPGQSEEKLIARLVASVREGRPIGFSGDRGLRINPIHVDDAARVVGALLEIKGSRTLNLAGPETVSICEIAERVGQIVGVAPILNRSAGDESMVVADHQPVADLLGQEMIPVSAGLRSMLK